MEGVGEIFLAAVAASPGEAEMKEIPADAAQTGQLQQRRGGNTAERLRRSLADASLRAVQPCLHPSP